MKACRRTARRTVGATSPILAALCLPGCYLSYAELAQPDAAPDRADADAPHDPTDTRDTAPDDTGPARCEAVVAAATVAFDDVASPAVTPRLAALPDGGVAVTYVISDASPVRVVYERLDATLRRVTGPVNVATDSFTWAEPALRDGRIHIAFGQAGDGGSVLLPVTLDGAPAGARSRVPLEHPSILHPSRSGFFWLAFRLGDENSLQLAHLDADGTLLHEPTLVTTGRYGSGHGATARPDGASHVVGYPREGPPGVRNGYVNALAESSALGPERLLADDGDDTVLPVRLGDSLVLVRRNDETLVLERTDFDSLELLERAAFASTPTRPMAGAVDGRLVVAYAASGTLHVDDYGTALAHQGELDVRLPLPSVGSGWSAAEAPDALYLALTLVDGPHSFPWIVRLGCAER